MSYKKIGISVVAVIALLIVVVLAVVLGSGALIIGEPGKAASQLLSGDITAPEVIIDKMSMGPVSLPDVTPGGASAESVTFDIDLRVNNTMNHFGGTVSLVTYEAYLSGSRNGEYSKIGDGEINNLVIQPNSSIVETTQFDSEYTELVGAVGSSVLQSESDLYMRVDGEADISLGITSFTVPFEQTMEVTRTE